MNDIKLRFRIERAFSWLLQIFYAICLSNSSIHDLYRKTAITMVTVIRDVIESETDVIPATKVHRTNKNYLREIKEIIAA